MIKALIVVCFVTLVVVPAMARGPQYVKVDNQVVYEIPIGSPVGHGTVGEFGVVEYQGRFKVSGHYEYGYVTDDPDADASYGEKEFAFILDGPSASQLPYWTRDGRIQELDFRNRDDFINAVIPKRELEKLSAHKITSVSGIATVWAEKLQTSVECDRQHNSAWFSAIAASDYAVSGSFAEPQGC